MSGKTLLREEIGVGRTGNHVFTHFCGKDQEGVLPRAMSAVKQSPWPIDGSREKRWDLEWLCAGCSHESRQRGGLQPQEVRQLSSADVGTSSQR